MDSCNTSFSVMGYTTGAETLSKLYDSDVNLAYTKVFEIFFWNLCYTEIQRGDSP